MDAWLYQHVVLPVAGTVINDVPASVWIVIICIAGGWVWKQFGWQGLLGLAVGVASLGIYRKGWQDATAAKPTFTPVPKPAPKPAKPKTILDTLKSLTGP